MLQLQSKNKIYSHLLTNLETIKTCVDERFSNLVKRYPAILGESCLFPRLRQVVPTSHSLDYHVRVHRLFAQYKTVNNFVEGCPFACRLARRCRHFVHLVKEFLLEKRVYFLFRVVECFLCLVPILKPCALMLSSSIGSMHKTLHASA